VKSSVIPFDADVAAGIRAWRLWTAWAWLDTLQRYRRSLIGPFWMTISMALTIGGMGLVFGTLFRQPLTDFFPYLTAGMITWQLISGMVNESCTVFTLQDRFIKQLNLPLSIYPQRNVAKQFILFAHHFAIFVLVAVIFRSKVTVYTLLAPVGLAVLFLNGVAVSLFIGTLATRFRDIGPIVTNLVQLAFFVTPVLWKPELLGHRRYIADLNPLYHFVEIVRRPLLGELPSGLTMAVVLAITVINTAVALWFFGRYRKRIAYWV
jgi:ABC-2 type transport system permease protein/lipopolysaccharide transport system permease protein